MVSEITIVLEWFWKNFGKDILRSSATPLKAAWETFGYKHAAEKYAENMKKQYGIMKIWRMSSPIPLSHIFTKVNILHKPSALQNFSKELLEKKYLVEAAYGKITEEGKDAIGVVRENKRLFILGKPGAGKTTFLKYLTLQAIEGSLDQIPIFIPLKSFSEARVSLLDFIIQQFQICNFPEPKIFINTILKQGEIFRLTDHFFEKLHEEEIETEIIDKLKQLKDQEYLKEEDFINDLKKILGTIEYISTIIRCLDFKGKRSVIFTSQLWDNLKSEKIPLDVLLSIQCLIDNEYKNQSEFELDIKAKVGRIRYESLILQYAKTWKVIVLCDGLDEVNKEGGMQERIIQQLIDFSHEFDNVQMVVTCRLSALDYCFEKFTYVQIADFNKHQIREFVYKWFFEDKKIANRFLYEFENNPNKRLHEIASSPLLLTLLCIAFEETLHFPSRRSEIYEEALDALLKKWDSSRRITRDEIYRNLSLGRKRQMFAHIAAETFTKGEYLFEGKKLEEYIVSYLQNLPQADHRDDIDGSQIINAIIAQHGIFVERSQKVYSFSHLTFHEYYTAKYIIENSDKGTLANLINNYVDDDRWHEVFLLVAEMLHDANSFFEIFLSKLDGVFSKNAEFERILREIEKMSDEVIFLPPQGCIGLRIKCILLSLSFLYHESKNAILAFNAAMALSKKLINQQNDSTFWIANVIAKNSNNFYLRPELISIVRSLSKIRTNAKKCTTGKEEIISISSNAARLEYKIVLNILKKIKWTELYEELTKIKVPSEKSSRQKWREFDYKLLNYIPTYKSIEYYNITQEQSYEFTLYLQRTLLLLECLEIAYVSNREAIKYFLIRPPQTEIVTQKLNTISNSTVLFYAAEKGNIEAQFQVGWQYLSGKELSIEDSEKIFNWCVKSAENGHPIAQAWVALIYAISKYPERRDRKKALEYARRAFSQIQLPICADALSAAYAANNLFVKAITHQKKAIELLKKYDRITEEQKKESLEKYYNRLALYEKHELYISEKF